MKSPKTILPAALAGFLIGLFSLVPLSNIGVPLPTPGAIGAVIFLSILSPVGFFIFGKISSQYPVLLQMAKFGTVGTLNTLLELTIVNGLIMLTGAAVGLHFVAFKTLSFITAVGSAYLWNKFWTFESRTKMTRGEVMRFGVVAVVGLLINVGTAHTVVNVIGAPSGISDVLWANAGVLIAVFTAMTWNFLSQKFIIFRERNESRHIA